MMRFPSGRIVASAVLSLGLIVSMLVLADGCVTANTGTPLDQTKISGIQKGVTNKTQMEAMFGPPTNLSMATDGSGKRIATWVHSHTEAQATTTSWIPVVDWFNSGATATSHVEQLQATYDTNDVVIDYQYSQQVTQSESQGGLFGSQTNTTTTTLPTSIQSH